MRRVDNGFRSKDRSVRSGGEGRPRCLPRHFRRLGLVAALVAVASGVTACARSTPAPSAAARRYDEGTRPSPRMAFTAKGGGHYKLGKPYRINGRWYVPREDPGYDRRGIASWYGADFHARKTANGEIYDMNALTAAHPTLPLPSYVWVTNERNGRTVLVRVNDRGPYAHDRIIDLSRATARALGFENHGLARVRVRYAGRAPLDGRDHRERAYLQAQPWFRGDDALAAAPAFPARRPNPPYGLGLGSAAMPMAAP